MNQRERLEKYPSLRVPLDYCGCGHIRGAHAGAIWTCAMGKAHPVGCGCSQFVLENSQQRKERIEGQAMERL